MAKSAVIATLIATRGGDRPAGGLAAQRPAGSSGDASRATAVGVAAGDGGVQAGRFQEALRERLGAERYAVWFGESVTFEATADPAIVITVGNAFSQEWLKRTFRGDIEAAVEKACGRGWQVTWRTSAAPGAATPGASKADVPPPGGRARSGGAERRHRGGSDRTVGRGLPAVVPTAESRVFSLPGRLAGNLGSFVVGQSNRMAFAAVELAASRPGAMSPLVIHGPSGVGKSHLLEGICGRFRELHPGSTTLHLSAEQFTTGFLQALHGSGLPGFRRGCRQADLLVIDDLQFFAGKRATLMEVQQTVDALHRQGRQMVFASDRDLEALDGLGPELLARLRGGMAARIETPDYDVRRGIVAAVAAVRGVAVPDDVVHYVATHMTRHARELIGALNRLEATSHMLGLPVTIGMAEEALSDLVRSSARSVRLADIERAVCSAFGIEAGSLQSSRRARAVNHPRMLAMFLARRHTTSALTEIGSYFGRRSHSTVISAQKAVDEWVARGSRIVLADTTWDVEEAIRRVEDVLRAG